MNLYAFADKASSQFGGQITAMVRNGLAGLEIRGVDGQSIADITMEKARKVRHKLDDAGLVCWPMGSPIGKIGIDSTAFLAHLYQLRHTLELTDALGARNLRMFSFFVPDGKAEEYRHQVLDRMGQMLEVARGSGVAMCHENEKGIYGDIAVTIEPHLCVFDGLQGMEQADNRTHIDEYCYENSDVAFNVACNDL